MHDDINDELLQHIEERAAELMRDGLTKEEAYARARRQFGNLTSIAERSRDVWRWPTLDEFSRAATHAARSLRRGGAYTLVSIVTLALGIGANTAIFSIIDAALLRGLPYKNPGRLVQVGFPILGSAAVGFDPYFVAWRHENHSFDGLIAYNGNQFTLTGAGEPERVDGRTVPADYLAVLGGRVELGRDFAKSDDHAGADPVAIITDSLWRRHWNADPSIIGRSILLDRNAVAVIGVLPPDFPVPGYAEILTPAQFPDPVEWNPRSVGLLSVIGRLKPGVSAASAAADLDRISRAHDPDKAPYLKNSERGAHVVALSLEGRLMGDVRPALLVMICAVGVVLLIACANVASLQLSRFNGRIRELGVRAALGASRAQLIRLVLAESLLLSATGAAAGCAGALFLIRLARPFYRLLHLANPEMITLNAEVAAYALGLTLICACIFSIGPAALAARTDAQSALRAGSDRAPTGLRNTFRAVLVAGEMAMAILLVLGAGLLLRSFSRLLSVDPGFETRGILTATIDRPPSQVPGQDDPRDAAFVRDLMLRLARVPGLISASAASSPPFTNYRLGSVIRIEGRAEPVLDGRGTPIIAVTSDYFRTLRIPILSGRGFSDSDSSNHPHVAVVNVAFAKDKFPGEDPIGRRFHDGPRDPSNSNWTTIVGVAANSRHEDLTKEAVPEIFVPFDQRPQQRAVVTLRATGKPEALATILRGEVRAIDPDQPISDVATMEERVGRTLRDRRVETFLLGSFAALALLLAAAGVYGVMSYSVAQSTREIGVRIALGATPAGVTSEVLLRALRLSIAGVAVGLISGWFLTRFLAGLLYGVSAKDPVIFTFAPLALLAIALLASLLPARRAATVDPVDALRAD
jgi:putative ABC transport system permease protein